MRDLIQPDWNVTQARAFVTAAPFGDMGSEAGRAKVRELVPAEPRWMHQVHGVRVIDADSTASLVQADAAVARKPGTVCVVKIADCMPVFFAGSDVVGVAHAGWRGLAGGVLEATLDAMRVAPDSVDAWLGPAIGPRVYEVGDEVRAAFGGHQGAFEPTRPGHWLVDLYAIARAKLQAKGVRRIGGGGFCTYTERDRFFSYRRDRTEKRMAALIWLAQKPASLRAHVESPAP
ncbi:MAG TPA: peptidoglycan editing factor PgeF [Burkholderiales bacterium]|nr:peptidoglycan editing factor PgeF [Burkholderiales bacterium]